MDAGTMRTIGLSPKLYASIVGVLVGIVVLVAGEKDIGIGVLLAAVSQLGLGYIASPGVVVPVELEQDEPEPD